MANMVASLVHTISTHTADVTSLAYSNGKLASASADKTVRLWGTEDYGELPCSPLLGHTYVVHHCTFSPLATMLATCSTDGKLILWDSKTGEVRATFEHESKCSIRVCKFSPDSARIASGSEDDTICLWEIASRKIIRSFPGHEDTIVGLAYSPDSHFLVSGCVNGDLFVWDALYGHGKHLALKIDAHDMGVTCVEFSPTFGSADKPDAAVAHLLMASGGKDNLIKLWTFTAQLGSPEVLLKCHASLPGHTDTVISCAFSPSGSLLASGSLDRSVRLWNPLSCEALFSIDGCHSRYVACVAFSEDGSRLATGSMDKTVKVWKLTDTSRIMSGLRGFEEPEAAESGTIPAGSGRVAGWTVDDVCQWLGDLGLENHTQSFRTNAIDGAELQTLTHTDLETSLGVSALGHRNKILRLRDQGGMVPQVASPSAPPLPAGLARATAPPVDLTRPERSWTAETVAQWLGTLGMAEYQRSFTQHAIDGAELFALSASDLESKLGVAALGHRNKILRGRVPAVAVVPTARPQSPSRVPPASLQSPSTSRSRNPESPGGPEEFLCPITMEMMRDPVIAADGYTYDRGAIASWLSSGKDRSPMTNAVLPHRNLTPNRTLKMLIQKHLEQAHSK